MIPLVNLADQYASIKPEIDAAIAEVVTGGQFILGPAVERFERGFAEYCGSAHGIGVSSGTSALHLALLACGVGPGDEVITVSATFAATVAAIRYCGATPVMVDIQPDLPLIDPDAVEAAIGPRTKAILPVHLYGHVCDMERLADIAMEHRLALIEDASQAHGALYGNRRAGSMGDVGCFSCYPGKNLGAFGEAGIVVTDNAYLADRIRSLRNWGQSRPQIQVEFAYNYRLDSIQAAVLAVKLRYLDQWNAARRTNAAAYGTYLVDAGLELPRVPEGTESVYHIYHVQTDHRDALAAWLKDKGVGAGVHYPLPVHLQPGYLGFADEGSLPNTERLFSRTLSLPVCPELSASDQNTVVNAVKSFRRRAAEAAA